MKKEQLVQQYDTLSTRVAIKQMDYEEADERVKEANERADRMEAYIKTQNDTLVDLEEKATKLGRRAEIAEQVYEMVQFAVDGRNLLERFLESIEQVVEKVRDGFRR